MSAKLQTATVLLLVFVFFACKKTSTSTTNTSTVSTAIPNIDSIKGYYQGSTAGDSLYSWVESSGIEHQWLHSFTWADSVNVTSADTFHVTVASKYNKITIPYGDSLTYLTLKDTATLCIATSLQLQNVSENGYVSYNATLADTTDGFNHLVINVWYSYNKHYKSDLWLSRR